MTGSSKRRRMNPSPLNSSRSHSPLSCVRVVCQNGPDILRLPHIVGKLNEFLDSSRKWMLHKACASDFPYLVERLLVRQEAETTTGFLHRSDYRQWQWKRGLLKAVKVGNSKIVQLLVTLFQDCSVSDQLVEKAAGRGLSEILTCLAEGGFDIEWSADAVSEAIKNGHFELVRWIHERLSTVSVEEMTEWAELAADKGDLATVKWVCGMVTERDSFGHLLYLSENPNLWGVVQHATNSGQLHVLTWIMDEPNPTTLLYELLGREFEDTSLVKIYLYGAAADGHVGVVTWLIQHYPGLCNSVGADYRAAENGHLDFLRLLLSSPIEKCNRLDTVNVAAGKGHLDIVKFLVAEGYPADHAMDNAAECGSLLHENILFSYSLGAMNKAASNGHLNVVKWLYRNRVKGCTVAAMNNAAGCGHLSLVKWLHENRTEGCTTRAMDEAASSGHLEVVRWLHSNRPEGCTSAAMDNAAINGHLDVLKWLHANRSEGCTTAAIDEAAGNNHLIALEWLDQNRVEGFTAQAVRNAVRSGNLEVLQWLFSR